MRKFLLWSPYTLKNLRLLYLMHTSLYIVKPFELRDSFFFKSRIFLGYPT